MQNSIPGEILETLLTWSPRELVGCGRIPHTCIHPMLPIASRVDFVHCSVPHGKKKILPAQCFENMPLKVLRDNNYLLLRLLLICFMEMGVSHFLLARMWLRTCALLLPPSTSQDPGCRKGPRHSRLPLVSQDMGRDYSSKHLGSTRKNKPWHVEALGTPPAGVVTGLKLACRSWAGCGAPPLQLNSCLPSFLPCGHFCC